MMDLLLNLVVVFQELRCNCASGRRDCKSAGYPHKAREKSALSVWAYSVRSTFAHSIFEGSPSKEGFHGTHGTPSRFATVREGVG